ncbi:MAG: hypothetical protein R3A80_04495 [Bdellovibrionota bacterium]
MFKLKSKRHPREVAFMFVAVGAGLFMYHSRIYKPRSAELLSAVSKIDERKKEVSANKMLIGELKVKVGDLNKRVEQAQNDKPTRFLSELINEINSKEGGVRVNSYTSQEKAVENSIYAVSLNLELESTFLDLATLMERLEEKYKFLEFKKVETTKVDDFLQKSLSKVSLSIYLDKERN